jgi:hypothetical protein
MLGLLISAALAATSTVNSVDVPPAPTLIWRDPAVASEAYVRGLTQSGTMVSVTLDGVIVKGIRYGSSRNRVNSFAVPWPKDLPPGVYVLTAAARRGNQRSLDSMPVHIVVPGVKPAPPRLA